jgi:hypothetical protein
MATFDGFENEWFCFVAISLLLVEHSKFVLELVSDLTGVISLERGEQDRTNVGLVIFSSSFAFFVWPNHT